MIKEMIRYEIAGTNRGGRDHLDAVLSAHEHPEEIAFHFTDSKDGRAESLAAEVREEGMTATSSNAKARNSSRFAVQTIAVDSAEDLAQIHAQPQKAQLLNSGILVAETLEETLGGVVLGIGTTTVLGGPEGPANAPEVHNRIAELVGPPLSSRFMAAPLLNEVQMASTRERVHTRLAEKSLQHLMGNTPNTEMFVEDGINGKRYSLATVEVNDTTPRRKLLQVARHEILPTLDGVEVAGVLFFAKERAWLFGVLASRSAGTWHVDNTVELPRQTLVMPKSKNTTLHAARRMAATAARVWATD